MSDPFDTLFQVAETDIIGRWGFWAGREDEESGGCPIIETFASKAEAEKAAAEMKAKQDLKEMIREKEEWDARRDRD